MTKVQIKQAYDDCVLSYEDALEALEKLGMNGGDADDYLIPSKR